MLLDQIDLNQKLDHDTYQAALEPLSNRLAELQRTAKTTGLPTLVILEGWDASGKGTLLNRILRPLDPRGFKVYDVSNPAQDEQMRPYLWPFWVRTPTRGQIVFMNRSWYRRLLEGRLEGSLTGKHVDEAFEETRNFERQLHYSGTLLFKFFIHISKEVQKKRLTELDKGQATTWRVSKPERFRHKHYDELAALTEEMLHSTDTGNATWTIVPGHDRRYAEIQMLTTLVDGLEEHVASITRQAQKKTVQKETVQKETVIPSTPPLETVSTPTRFEKIDLSVTADKDSKKTLRTLQERLRNIQYTLYRERIPAVIAFEGWDAAGKGGAIKRLTERLDPRGYEVHPVAAPNDFERAHYHLWRFWKSFPKAGHIAIFDRTWYGRVLVERVEGFCSPEEWRRAYSEFNDMESQWYKYGTIIAKFWLHIDSEEQLRRFNERKNNPGKSWKITDEDWRNREKWDKYKEAVEEMILRTSTHHAPWTIVEANDKKYARLKVLQTVVDTSEAFFESRGIKY